MRIYRYSLLIGWKEMAGIWGWRSWLGGWMVAVLAQIAFFSMLGNLLESPERLEYLLIGNALVAGCTITNWAVSASTWDRGNGVYPLLVIAPSSLQPTIIGRTSIWLGNGIATALAGLALVHVFFGIPTPWPQVLVAVPLVVLACASCFFLALVLGAFVARAPRSRNIVHRISTTVILTFSGASVPTSFWPEWIELLAQGLPVTHGLQAIRTLLDSGPVGEIVEAAALEAALGLAWLGLGVLLIDRLAEGGRRDGSIEFAS